MKKIFIIATILFLAASCSKQPSVAVVPSPTPTPTPVATPTPDPTAGWISYISPIALGFSIKYPSEFGFNTSYEQATSMAGSYIAVCDQDMVACVFVPKDQYKGTNFDGAGVSININKTLNTEAKCYNFAVSTNEAQTPVSDVTINGVVFKSATGGGGAAGHYDKLQVYRNFHNSSCYELAQDIVSTQIANYPTGTVTQFDENTVWQKLQGVVDTFQFANSVQPTAWKFYKEDRFGLQFQYPAESLLNLMITNKDGSVVYGLGMNGEYNQYNQPDQVIETLNQDVQSGANAIYVLISNISSAFPKDLAAACKQNNLPATSDPKQCLNSGGDAGPGVTQEFIDGERNALASTKVGGDFSYFSGTPTQSEKFEGQFPKIVGRVIQAGSHKVYAYAVPDQQAPQLDLNILAFNNSGDMIQIFYHVAQLNSDNFTAGFAKLAPNDILHTSDWKTITKIAATMVISN